jgi:antitoxin HicB
MLEYPVTLTPDDNDTILISFVDLPAQTFGEDREDALRRAVDALATILDAYIKDGREIPAPSTGRVRVTVPALIEAKIRLYEAMRAAKVTKAELGRRLDWHSPQVDRLFDMKHISQIDQLEAAFTVLDKRLVVGVEDRIPAPLLNQAAAMRKTAHRVRYTKGLRQRAGSKRG